VDRLDDRNILPKGNDAAKTVYGPYCESLIVNDSKHGAMTGGQDERTTCDDSRGRQVVMWMCDGELEITGK